MKPKKMVYISIVMMLFMISALLYFIARDYVIYVLFVAFLISTFRGTFYNILKFFGVGS